MSVGFLSSCDVFPSQLQGSKKTHDKVQTKVLKNGFLVLFSDFSRFQVPFLGVGVGFCWRASRKEKKEYDLRDFAFFDGT